MPGTGLWVLEAWNKLPSRSGRLAGELCQAQPQLREYSIWKIPSTDRIQVGSEIGVSRWNPGRRFEKGGEVIDDSENAVRMRLSGRKLTNHCHYHAAWRRNKLRRNDSERVERGSLASSTAWNGLDWFLEKELNSNKNTIPTNPILLKLNHQLSWIMQTHACVNESLCFSHESFGSHYVLPILDIEVKKQKFD